MLAQHAESACNIYPVHNTLIEVYNDTCTTSFAYIHNCDAICKNHTCGGT